MTGGCGYIGSHTIVDLIENGYEVVSIDNLSRSDGSLLKGIEKITGKRVFNHKIDLSDRGALEKFFRIDPRFDGVIHFAAFKSVGESVQFPVRYFSNNVVSHINLLECIDKHRIPSFVFSSSCAVYGNVQHNPVTEATHWSLAESPYGRTKQMCEQVLFDSAPASDVSFVSLRYFNPVGAHPSGHIGEIQIERPSNLVPCITQSAAGLLPRLLVHGNDYPTRDGTCIRDYVHVMDVARAHRLALERIKTVGQVEVLNLGSGMGMTVMEMIRAFERNTGRSLRFDVGPRRPGDVTAIYSDYSKAKNILGWQPEAGIDDIMKSAWHWQTQLAGKTSAK